MIGEIFSKFMTIVESPTNVGGLNTSAILGFPEQGRVDVDPPVAALSFNNATAYISRRRKTRIGDASPSGSQCRAVLFVFASDEEELLSLIDNLLNMISMQGGFRLDDNTPIKTSYGSVQRASISEDTSERTYVVTLDITFSWR